MKTILAVSIVLLTTSNLALADNALKRYFVESAKIDYEIKASGEVMGMMKTKTIGKKRLIFNQHGANELKEENKIEKRTQAGKTKTFKSHNLSHMKGSMVYSIDFKKERIMRMKNPAMAVAGLMGGQDMATAGEAMMKKMGGKKVGTDKVAGHSCDVWDIRGIKQCMYKGVPLRIESDLMGVRSIEIATKAEFDISLTNDDFKLPDFPIYSIGDDGSKPLVKLDKSKLEAMDAKVEKQTNKESNEMQEMLGMMATAAAKAGMEKGKPGSEGQQASMEQTMSGMMLPIIRKKMLAKTKMMEFGKNCLGAADTLREANKCSEELAAKFPNANDGGDDFDSWNSAVKKDVMNDINQFLQSVPCIEKASNMQQFQKCMPEDFDD